MTPAPAADGVPRGVIDPTRRRGRTFVRGCIKHCGVCGRGHLFRRWFRMLERCPRCGLRFERVEGHWTGDIGVNTILSFGTLLAVLMGGFLLTWPDPPVLGLVVATIGTALLAPLFFLPFSKTIWLAADLMMRPLAPGEVDEGFGPNDAVAARRGLGHAATEPTSSPTGTQAAAAAPTDPADDDALAQRHPAGEA